MCLCTSWDETWRSALDVVSGVLWGWGCQRKRSGRVEAEHQQQQHIAPSVNSSNDRQHCDREMVAGHNTACQQYEIEGDVVVCGEGGSQQHQEDSNSSSSAAVLGKTNNPPCCLSVGGGGCSARKWTHFYYTEIICGLIVGFGNHNNHNNNLLPLLSWQMSIHRLVGMRLGLWAKL
eukprot:GHVS01107317.1.p1 GENE.GHVS01107317.1~~GHVS01107317.1.p1  ORF type:complete len:176 (-),score=46.50 GHVS01107317.1:8-535(-)